MNKVKAIFKSDSDDSLNTSPRGTSTLGSGEYNGRPTNNLPSERTTGTHVGSDRHTGSHVGDSHQTPVNDSGVHSGETREVHSSHAGGLEGLKANLPGHKHNVEKNASLEGADGEKTHDHKHLAPVTKEHHHEHETEEVQRVREHDRHVHHVQHHVQPVLDTQHKEHQHKEQVHDVTRVHEQHVNTDEDKKIFQALNQHKDEVHHHGKERTVVDKGEIVNENVHHHVHHVVQPVIERDTHHHSTIHTTIPVKHTTHEAPIIHQSSTHEPMQMKDFLSQGGDLKSKLTHRSAGVLAEGDCARDVDGPAETLAEKLHLGGGSHADTNSGVTNSVGAAHNIGATHNVGSTAATHSTGAAHNTGVNV